MGGPGGSCGLLALVDFVGLVDLSTLSCKNVIWYLEHCFNIPVAVLNEESKNYLSYERGICKWRSNFCAQVELLIIDYICRKTLTSIIYT